MADSSSKRVENTVGKGEIARYEQFLLFPQCFQKACFPGASKGVIVWEWVRRHFWRKLYTNKLRQESISIKTEFLSSQQDIQGIDYQFNC